MKITQATLKKIIQEEIEKMVETQAGAGAADESEGELEHEEAEEEGTVDEGFFGGGKSDEVRDRKMAIVMDILDELERHFADDESAAFVASRVATARGMLELL